MKNIDKLIQYLRMVSRDPINLDGEIIGIPVNDIKLSTSFFFKDNCIGCGSCCVPEANLLTASEYSRLQEIDDEFIVNYGLDPAYIHELRDNIQEDHYNINGKDVCLYVFPSIPKDTFIPVVNKIKHQCHWLIECDGRFKCAIHPVRSITCKMPHLRIHQSQKGNTSIGVSQFGRNWALGCPIKFESVLTEDSFEEIKTDYIQRLHQLEEAAFCMNIPTYLPEVMKYIDNIPFSNYEDYLGKSIINTNFTKKFF